MGEEAVIGANLVLSYRFGQHNSCLKPARSPGERANWTAARAFSDAASKRPHLPLGCLPIRKANVSAQNFPRPPFTNQNGRTIHALMNLHANSSRSTHFIMAERGLE